MYSMSANIMSMDRKYDVEGVLKLLVEAQGERSLRSYASSIGCSAAYLCDVYHGNRAPGPKILKVLGLQRQITKQITYKKWRTDD